MHSRSLDHWTLRARFSRGWPRPQRKAQLAGCRPDGHHDGRGDHWRHSVWLYGLLADGWDTLGFNVSGEILRKCFLRGLRSPLAKALLSSELFCSFTNPSTEGFFSGCVRR